MIKYFEQELEKVVSSYKIDSILYDAFYYSIFSGGKRIRPLLSLYLAKSLNYDLNRVIDIAIAIEFIHNYSLVHDDLPFMDNDEFRRNKLTTHAKYGADIAILAGDGLLTEAFSIIARSKYLKNKDKIISKLCEYAGLKGMIYGQALDINSNEKDIDTIKLIHENKTQKLILASIDLVLVELEIEDSKYIQIAKLLGSYYQINDDIKDIDKINDNSNIAKLIGLEQSKTILSDIKNNLLCLLDDNCFDEYIKKVINE